MSPLGVTLCSMFDPSVRGDNRTADLYCARSFALERYVGGWYGSGTRRGGIPATHGGPRLGKREDFDIHRDTPKEVMRKRRYQGVNPYNLRSSTASLYEACQQLSPSIPTTRTCR